MLRPLGNDPNDPRRTAEAVREMSAGEKHYVDGSAPGQGRTLEGRARVLPRSKRSPRRRGDEGPGTGVGTRRRASARPP
jgi:hypothetical protein